jgi:hypothetical protein
MAPFSAKSLFVGAAPSSHVSDKVLSLSLKHETNNQSMDSFSC